MDMGTIKNNITFELFSKYGFSVTVSTVDSTDGSTIVVGDPMSGYAIDLGTASTWGKDSIRTGSRKLMIAGLSSAPRPGDRVNVGILKYRVVDCDIIQPGGVVLYYEVYVK